MQPQTYLLDLPAEDAARLIALELLADIRETRRRLEGAGDPEALHDLRVAVRRLRTCLRNHRPELRRWISRGASRRLRAIARASRESRDLEVQLAWLGAQEPGLSPRPRHGVHWMRQRLEERKREADRGFRELLGREFERAVTSLDQQLRRSRSALELDSGRLRRAAAVAGPRILRLSGNLERALARVRSVRDIDQAHRARIDAKRLRYLLEPIEPSIEGAKEVVEQLTAMQDGLGDLHDSDLFLQVLAGSVGDAPIAARPGLSLLDRQLRARAGQAFARVEADWLGGAAEEFFRRVARLPTAITARATASTPLGRNIPSSAGSARRRRFKASPAYGSE